MPGEIIGEFILRPLAELLVQGFCYLTGRVIVPVLSLGTVRVEPAPKRVRIVIPKWHGFHRGSDGIIIVDCEMGALLGLAFWGCVGVAVYLVYR